MKTQITLVTAIALLAGSSAFAQSGTGHQFSKTGNYYKVPANYEVPAKRVERRENRPASQSEHIGASREWSRTGNYREPKAVQPSEQHEGRATDYTYRAKQPKVVAPAWAPNRFGTTNP